MKTITSIFAIFIFTVSILNAQNVGIDVAAPAGKLHVKTNSTISFPQLLLEEDDNDYSRLVYKNNATTKYWATAAYPAAVDSLAWFNIWNSSTGNLLVLNGKGKLGINTTPAYPLSLNNDLGDKIALWGGGGYGAHYGFGIQTSLLQIHTANSNDDVAFGYGSSGAFTENVRITGDGKVGIGTNDPIFPLSFGPALGDKIALFGTSTTAHFGIGIQNFLMQIHTSNTNDDIAFGVGGSSAFTENMRITGDGKVGIGTNDPVFPLSFASSNGDKISLYGNNASAHYGFGIQNSLFQIHSSLNVTDIAFGYGGSTAFTETMRIKGNGRLGLGTNAPDSKLHVYIGASGIEPNPGSIATFENTGSAYINILSGNETGVLFGADGNGTDGGILYNSTIPNGFAFRTNGNVNRLMITDNGNVGIGNFVPSFPLSFPSTLGDKITLWGSSPTSHFGFGIQPAVMQFITGESTSDFVFGYGGSTAFTEGVRITGDGKVGIGTNNPAAELEVDGYSKMGSNAPKIKMIKLTGITSSSQGNGTSFTHGLNVDKILAVNIMVDAGALTMPPAYTFNSGYEYHFYINDVSIHVNNESGNSANILSKPVRIVITYEE